MMLGLLLARAGVNVVVIEKHADFLRDFRGDTIHPSTLEVMHDLGLLEEFLQRPHQKVHSLSGQIGDTRVKVADFSHLPTRCKFIAFMPQWDFLDFLADEARRYPTFRLLMETEVTDLIWDGETVAGVLAEGPDGQLEIRADLVVGADGRRSIVREKARLEVLDIGAPMDVLWMAISREAGDPEETFGRVDAGRMFVMINRRAYWQCAYVIPKDSFEAVRNQGLEAFRTSIARLAPYLSERMEEIASWDQVKLLTVSVDRLKKWHRDGLLCIGDAAHAMSPIGGVGINLAVQDAVAAANILAGRLGAPGAIADDLLAQVQKRRQMPTRLTQAIQVFIQRRFISEVLASRELIAPPLPVRLAQRFPVLQRIPGRLVGLGVRPEHVGSQLVRAS